MEYTAKGNTPGYTKRFIHIIDSNGSKLRSFSEAIDPNGVVHKIWDF